MMLALGMNNSSAQGFVRQGNTFKSTSTRGAKGDTLVTKFSYEDRDGKKYPIIINRGTGSCYIWKKSSKSGKIYKSYMKTEISMQVAKECKIEYKPKNK